MKTVTEITRLFFFLYIIGSLLVYIIASILSKSFALEDWQDHSCIFFAVFDLLVILISVLISVKYYYSSGAIQSRFEYLKNMNNTDFERVFKEIKNVKDEIKDMKHAHDYYNK